MELKTIVFISGLCGSGKSTVSRYLSNKGYPVFHTSAVFTKVKDELLKGSTEEAPEKLNSIIYERLIRWIEGHRNDQVFVVETFPRSVDQIKWIENDELGKLTNFNLKFFYIYAGKEERKLRMKDRNPERWEKFDSKRFEKEDLSSHFNLAMAINSFVQKEQIEAAKAKENGWCAKDVNLIFVDSEMMTAEEIANRISWSCPHVKNKLDVARTMATNVFYERNGYELIAPDPKRMIDRAKEELDELLAEVKKENPNIDDINFEFSDVIQFMFCVADSIGISTNKMIEVVNEKAKINQARLHFGKKEGITSGNLVIERTKEEPQNSMEIEG